MTLASTKVLEAGVVSLRYRLQNIDPREGRPERTALLVVDLG
jgi:hypothetical protein